jgi:hypothetical protein
MSTSSHSPSAQFLATRSDARRSRFYANHRRFEAWQRQVRQASGLFGKDLFADQDRDLRRSTVPG